MKPNPEAPIDQIIRHLALAAGIANKRRMTLKVRLPIARAIYVALDEGERLRAKGKKPVRLTNAKTSVGRG